jgi:hypothetical protein
MNGPPIAAGRVYLIPSEALTRIPAGGLHADEEVARLPGTRRIDNRQDLGHQDVVPGPSSDVYAFHRGATQRNLYRIPIQ